MKFTKKLVVVFCLLFVTMFAFQSVVPENYSVVSVAEAASKVKINKKKATIHIGEKLQLKVEGADKKVKWSTSDASVASVNKKGVVTGKAAGKATITAKAGKKKYTCKVTVKSVISVDKTELYMEENQTETLKITFAKIKGYDFTLKVSSSDNNVITCDFDSDSKGAKMTVKAVGSGSATITITEKKSKQTIVIPVTVAKDTKWNKQRVTEMLKLINDTLDSLNSALDYSTKALKYGGSYTSLAISAFVKAAGGVKECIDYSAELDPVVAADGTTMLSMLNDAYAVYTSFDSSKATRYNISITVATMSAKFLNASKLFVEFAKQFQ